MTVLEYILIIYIVGFFITAAFLSIKIPEYFGPPIAVASLIWPIALLVVLVMTLIHPHRKEAMRDDEETQSKNSMLAKTKIN